MSDWAAENATPRPLTKVTANMLGGEVLDVAQVPRCNVSHSLQPGCQPNDNQAIRSRISSDGDFTLHGVTKPLQIVAVAEQLGGLVHLRGQFSVRQTQFGITPYSTAFGAVGVADELKIWGDLWVTAR